jgi:hypothetical protein
MWCSLLPSTHNSCTTPPTVTTLRVKPTSLEPAPYGRLGSRLYIVAFGHNVPLLSHVFLHCINAIGLRQAVLAASKTLHPKHFEEWQQNSRP